MHARRTRRAFTLVELIVVVVILGILAGIGLVSYQQVTKRAQDRAIETTVSSLASEAQALAASRADGHFVADDLTRATGDLPPLPEAAATAAAWQIKAAPYSFVTAYGQLAIRLAADGTAAGVAALSQSSNCLLTRITPTGAPTLRLVGPVGGSCSGDTALAAQPSDPVQWTDPSVAGPPARPTGLAAQLTGNTVTLTWTANTETDLAGYRITVDGVAQPELLSSPTATIPAVPGEHTVTVVAVDKSALSSDASAPLVAAVPPAGPAHVSASVAHGVVSISWTPAPGATSYRIWHQVGTSVATILGQVLAPATSITDTDLPAGASVTYSVAAANRAGESGATPAGAPITAPTGVPAAVTATASGTAITVSWTAPTGATGFAVYRDGSATPAWSGTGTSWADTGLTAGSTHSYVVTASNAGGESVPSAATSATTAPSVPAGLTAVPGDGSVTLTWQSTAAADGYRVYRSTDGATFTLLGQAGGTTFTDGSLVNGTSYWYAVAAYNGAGESGQSTAASSKPLPPVPAVPAGVTTSVDGTAVTISWSAAARADGYRVYKNGTLLEQVSGATSTSATDTLPAGSAAVYSVAAYNLAGESAQSLEAAARTKSDAPTGVKATAVGTTITVTWSAPAGATSFSVYRDNATTPAWTGTGTSWSDTGLPAGTVHNYQVTALNAAGESAKSIPALATTVPPTPTALAATAGDGSVALSWGYDAGAQGFRVYRSADGTTFTLLAQAPSRSYTDATAVNGTTYSYAVSGFNGAGESGQSAPATTRPLPPLPAVPTGLTTSVTGSTVTVSWAAVARADGYRVYKNGALFGGEVVGSNSTTDTLTAGGTASYTVSAYNLAGESSQSAAASATAAPATPTGVTASASGTTITVGWTAPTGATSFKVYRDGSTTAAFTGIGTSWADTDLAAGSTHSYVVTATNAAGESPASVAVTATVVPAAPTGLAASISDNSVSLTWQTTSAATGYRVYRSTDAATFTLLGQAVGTTFADVTAVNGTNYTYAVTAFNGAGESGQSAPVTSRPLPPVPAVPAGLTTSVAGTAVTISWSSVPRADGYRVYRNGVLLGQLVGTSTTDTLTVGATVDYSVAAYNLAGESAQSPTVSATAAPVAPTGVTATASGTMVGLAWSAPAGATGFKVYRDGSATPVWTGTATSWTDTGLAAGSTHTYVVTATNAAGESAASASTSATLTPDTPTGLTSTVGDNSIALSWSPTAGAAGYRVYRAADNTGTPGVFTMLQQVAGTSYTDATAANGSTYWYAVSAFNTGGESSQSAAVSSRPLPPMPAIPAGVSTAVAGTTVTISWNSVARADGYRVYKNGTLFGGQVIGSTSTTDTLTAGGTAAYSVSAYNLAGESGQSATASATAKTDAPSGVTAAASGTTITVTWTAPPGATGFRVYRDGSATPAFTGTGTSWADTGLAAGSTHTYVVTATNAAGESPASSSVSATVVPGTPVGLTATAGDNTVALSWSPTPGATGYRLYRAPDTSGTAGTFLMIVQQAGTSFSDATAVNGSTYWYAVAAYNGAGESGQSAAATTKPLPPMPAVPTGVATSVTGTTVTISWNPVARADGYRVYKNGALFGGQVIGSTSTTDTLPVSGTATYTVSAYNLAGESSQSAGSTAAAKLAAPTGVGASSAGTTITVSWAAQAGVTSFKVYRDGAATPAFTGTGTSWADTGLAAGSTHSYVVTAVNGAGESDPSASATATLVPPMPSGLKVSAVSANPVVLTWNASAGATSYTVYRNGVTLATTATASYTDSAVTTSTGYTYAVEAFDTAGGSGRTATIGAVPGSAYAQAVLADAPGGYWRLDSSALRDLSGNGRDGSTTGTVTFGGPGAVPAQTNMSANTTNGGALLPAGAATVRTVEFWMRPDDLTSAMPISVGSKYSLWSSGGYFGFNTGNSDVYGISSAGMQGRWVHVVAEFHNGSVTGDKLWIDGQPKALSQVVGTPTLANALIASTVQAGGWSFSTTFAFAGAIDEVSSYTGTLTNAQVLAHFNAVGSNYVTTMARSAPADYWRLNDTAGTTAANSGTGPGGMGKDGTYSGGFTLGQASPLTTPDSAAKSVAFNGSTGRVNIGGSAAGRFAGGMSVAAWVYPTANTTYSRIVEFADGPNGSNIIFSRNGTTGGLTYVLFGPAGQQVYWITTNSTSLMPLNVWTHVALSVAATGQATIYVNGAAVPTTVAAGAVTAITSAARAQGYIGHSINSTGDVDWSGRLAEVGVFNRPLSAAEVAILYAAK